MTKRIIQKYTREFKSPGVQPASIRGFKPPVNKLLVDNKITQNLKRDLPKIPSFSSPALIHQISSFAISKNFDYYLRFAGIIQKLK